MVVGLLTVVPSGTQIMVSCMLKLSSLSFSQQDFLTVFEVVLSGTEIIVSCMLELSTLTFSHY